MVIFFTRIDIREEEQGVKCFQAVTAGCKNAPRSSVVKMGTKTQLKCKLAE